MVGLIGGQNELANEYRYSPFGERELVQESVGNALQFQARHYHPASQLYAWRARWYDPELQRFTSEDPIGLEGGINPYVFAENNPVNFRDPFGLCPRGQCEEIVVVASGCSNPEWTRGEDRRCRSSRGGSGRYGPGGTYGAFVGFGTRAGSGMNAPPAPEISPQCVAAIGLAGMTIAGDVLTVTGAGAAVRAGAFAYAAGRNAGLLARNPLMHGYVGAEIAAHALHHRSATFLTVTTLSGSIAGDAELAGFATASGFGVSGWDFVPVVASIRAGVNAYRTCR